MEHSLFREADRSSAVINPPSFYGNKRVTAVFKFDIIHWWMWLIGSLGSLQCSHNPATEPYSEPDVSITHPHILCLLRFTLTLSSHLSPLSPTWSLCFIELKDLLLHACFLYVHGLYVVLQLHKTSLIAVLRSVIYRNVKKNQTLNTY